MSGFGDEPIAVIGLACRLPMAANPEEFWRLLQDGASAIGEAPPERWAAESPPGYRLGGFLDGIDRFDSAFFGISPREAAVMDPRQRLVLELSWEALEHARIRPAILRGSRTGVFVGAIGDDYASLLAGHGPHVIGPHTMTGLHRAMIANRLSYRLGLRGPSIVVDTAQSSSLVAVHMACESLRRGESAMAIAGGVHLNLAPESTLAAARFGALSPDGRCFTFDERANGFVRGEGGGLVVLKPLSTAIADGDRIVFLILGGAVNNDGVSDGLTVPDEQAQAEVLRLACQRAGVAPADVQYVELHGSATMVGDPVEAAALGTVLGAAHRSGVPLDVGSVKTNIGHLEGAAGIAGLLKVAVSLAHRNIPASLNFERPNPRIPLEELGLRVRLESGPWPREDKPLLAGVSSFGMGGTNCHLVLSEAAALGAIGRRNDAGPLSVPSDVTPWVLSARSPQALWAQAGRLAEYVSARPESDHGDVGFSLVSTRSAFEHRAVVLGRERAGLLTELVSLAVGEPGPNTVCGMASAPNDPVLVFPGQGSQWIGMGVRLLATSEVFREGITECQEALAPFVNWSLVDVLRGVTGAPHLTRDDVVQPVLWAMMVSLARVWASVGVVPAAVVGHSQGEIAAATVAGALSMADAARVVALRSKALAALAGLGGMLSVALPAEAVADELTGWSGRAWLAAMNGPASTVVSGELDALEALEAHWENAGHRVRPIPVTYASHSPQVERLREEILAALASLAPQQATVPFMSTVTGAMATDTTTLDSRYWFENLRNPVRFGPAVTRLLTEHGHSLFVECSPHPVLTASVRDTMDAVAVDGAALGTLRRDEGGADQFWRAAASAYVHGAPVDWTGHYPGAREIDLPTYAFQRRRAWVDGNPPADRQQETARPDEPGLAGRLTGLPTADRHRELVRIVRVNAANVLHHNTPDDVDPRKTFQDLGFDSSAAVELRDRLAGVTGLDLAQGLLFDHPTPTALARYLDDALRGREPATTVSGPVIAAIDDPIAIIGMSCRFPGDIASPADLWHAVTGNVTAFSEFPGNRGWEVNGLYDDEAGSTGTTYTRQGGFLHDADRFDAAFFGISPREAEAMDPQQRLLLEGSWEALERAGINPTMLRGTPVGVFVGAMASDYGPRMHEPTLRHAGHLLTGTTGSVASGRVAYALGLEGPAITVDTACSSSLVAMDLAAQALRDGRCELALAGGVAVMATPGMFVEFSRQRGLAADGRCKPFAAAADGTAWSEGMGMLVLARLSDARRHGHPVLALLRGCAVNSDGASNGLTAPNGLAQQRVIRQALANAGLTAAEVDVVEAHGTGTTLGDPIEATALLATYGRNRPADRPVWLGSVKSNIGHTQAAAGVAGVIKMVMAMRDGVVPATLGVDEPSPKIDWSSGGVRLATQTRNWPETGRPRRAAVSAFGISGTNAHVILEGVPPRAPATPTHVTGVLPWIVSARTPAALASVARRLHDAVLAGDSVDPVAVGRGLVATRALFDHRAVVLARDTAGFAATLAALAEGRSPANAIAGVARDSEKTAFLFAGQGSQRPGMGCRLYQAFPVFAAALDEVCSHLDPQLDHPLREVMFAAEGSQEAAALYRTAYTQPALFALETALFRLFENWGLRPDFLLGHSVGEITAAHVADVLTLDAAATMVAARGRLMQSARSDGAMMSIQASEEELLPLLRGRDAQVCVAALNGPSSTVISGDADAVDRIARLFADQGRRTRSLRTSHAFHSAHMDDVLAEFRQVVSGLRFRRPTMPIVSNLTGRMASEQQLRSPDYWVQHIRRPVRYLDGVRLLRAEGATAFLELGPAKVLTAMNQHLVQDGDDTVALLPTLSADQPEDESVLAAVAALHTRGASVDWTTWFAESGDRMELPTYPFERQRYWLSTSTGGNLPRLGLDIAPHAFLKAGLDIAGSAETVLTGQVGLTSFPWLADHAVLGQVLLPGTAFVELALHAAAQVDCNQLDELVIHDPLPLPEHGSVALQIGLGAADGTGRRSVSVHSRHGKGPWARHATGFVSHRQPETAEPLPWPPPNAVAVDIDGSYSRLADKGLRYGPVFRGLRALWRSGGDLYAEVSLPEGGHRHAGGFAVHPALLDALLHPLVDRADSVRLPFSWTDVTLKSTVDTTLRVHLAESEHGDVTITATDTAGTLVFTVGALASRPAKPSRATPTGRYDSLYELDWVPMTAQEPVVARTWAVLGDDHAGLGRALTRIGVAAGTAPADVQLLPRFPASTADPDQPVPVAVRRGLRELLAAVQQWLGDERNMAARLVVITSAAVAVRPGDHVSDLTGAAEWGLIRSAQTENPGRIVLLDIDVASRTTGWHALPLALATGESQLAIRDGSVYAARLSHADSQGALVPPAGTSRWRLAQTEHGSLDGLALVPTDDNGALGAGQVRVAIRAAGLNFRDVVIALGLVPDDNRPVGWEAAGVVVEVGPDVTGLVPGDRVMGLLTGGIGPVSVTDHRLLTTIPGGWSFAEAAALPVAFLTAYYGLIDLAGLAPGETVLVHAATGGVGTVAVQLARHVGAEVYGTASPPKWSALRGMGLDEAHIASSRSPEFAERFRGSGIDVVLNSLAHDLVDASLGLQAPGGRFLEMGKADIRDPEQVEAVAPGVRYRAFDLSDAGPDRIQQMLVELRRLGDSGVLRPPPVTAWDIRRAPEALRFFSQARHIGKIVLTVPAALNPDGTVLITGGTGTLGGLVARHLVVAHGIHHVLLVSRHGSAADGVAELRSDLVALGATRVDIVACDTADRDALAAVLATVPEKHPLTAVVHSAGVLADSTVATLTDEQLDTVLRPKVDSAWHLHELTRDHDLAAFVLYSSVAGTFGTAGQANYAAANAFLDGLARHRHGLGLPATSVAWGRWTAVSAMTSGLSNTDRARMDRVSGEALTPDEGMALFDVARELDRPAFVASKMDIREPAGDEPVAPLLRGLDRARPTETRVSADTEQPAPFRARLAAMTATARQQALLYLVKVQAAGVLGHPGPDRVMDRQAFGDQGFDSLTVVELRNRLIATTGLTMPTTTLFRCPTPSALAEYLDAKLFGVGAA